MERSFLSDVEAIWASSVLNNSQKKATVNMVLCRAASVKGSRGGSDVESIAEGSAGGQEASSLGVSAIIAYKAVLARDLAEELTTMISEQKAVHCEGLWQATSLVRGGLEPQARCQLRSLNGAYAILRHIDSTWCKDLKAKVLQAMEASQENDVQADKGAEGEADGSEDDAVVADEATKTAQEYDSSGMDTGNGELAVYGSTSVGVGTDIPMHAAVESFSIGCDEKFESPGCIASWADIAYEVADGPGGPLAPAVGKGAADEVDGMVVAVDKKASNDVALNVVGAEVPMPGADIKIMIPGKVQCWADVVDNVREHTAVGSVVGTDVVMHNLHVLEDGYHYGCIGSDTVLLDGSDIEQCKIMMKELPRWSPTDRRLVDTWEHLLDQHELAVAKGKHRGKKKGKG